MTEYVTKREFDSFRDKVQGKIEDAEIKYVELEASIKHMQSTLNVILGALVSGVGSIIVILLTRGIK